MNQPGAQLPQGCQGLNTKEFLLFTPDQVRAKRACRLQDRVINVIDHRASIEPALHPAFKPGRPLPGFDRMDALHRMPKPRQGIHTHQAGLASTDFAQEQDFQWRRADHLCATVRSFAQSPHSSYQGKPLDCDEPDVQHVALQEQVAGATEWRRSSWRKVMDSIR